MGIQEFKNDISLSDEEIALGLQYRQDYIKGDAPEDQLRALVYGDTFSGADLGARTEKDLDFKKVFLAIALTDG